MGSPQLEHGYTRIANEILEVIAKIKMSPTQHRLIFIIWRYTYGFHRKEHNMTLSFLENATGCDKRNIQRELKRLEERNIIRQKTGGNKRVISFNKNYKQWDSDIGIGETTIGETDNWRNCQSRVGEIDNGRVGEIDNQERKKDNFKDKYNSIFEIYLKQNIIAHRELTKTMRQAIDKALKKYSPEEIKTAIQRYGEAFNDKSYDFCKFTMTLDKFLTQSNGIYDWTNEGQKYINYANFKSKAKTETEMNDLYNVNNL